MSGVVLVIARIIYIGLECQDPLTEAGHLDGPVSALRALTVQPSSNSKPRLAA